MSDKNSTCPITDSDTIQPFDARAEDPDNLEFVQDGGTKAWISVIGVWIVLFATFGYTYSFGVYQDFYTRIFLSHHSASKIAWIGSFQLMMPFVFGVVSGKLFDAGYFHALEIVGSALFTFSLFMLSLVKSQNYLHVFLSQGLGVGLGLGLTFVPAVSLTIHHFRRRKVLMTGIVMSGSSIGAIMFPIMLNLQIKSIGFPQAVRNSAYIVCGMLVLGNCLMRTAYKKTVEKGPQLNILSFFTDVPYILASIGAMGTMFGFYFPLIYLQLYSVTHGINLTLSFYSLAILNGASTFGRLAGNYLAQVYGPFNVVIPCTLLIGASIFSIFGIHDSKSLVIVSIFYGIVSGAWLSLAVACLSTLSRHPNEVGARTGLGLAIISFGTLGSAPVQGALLGPNFNWDKPIIFSAVLTTATSIVFIVTRFILVRERGTEKV